MVAASHASEVVTPPYDALTASERRHIADTRPDSFLTALPPDATDISGADLAVCRAAVERLVAAGRFVHRSTPFVVLYRLRVGAHVQTALLCDIDTTAVDDGLLIGHERTRRAREDRLVDYLREVRITSSPVCVMHDDAPDLAALIERATARPPDIDLQDDDAAQDVWVVDQPGVVGDLLATAAGVGPLVITDGHHRVGAARRFTDEATQAAGRRVLVALFPEGSVRMREFNRAVTPTPVTASQLVTAVRDLGMDVGELPGPEHPQRPGQVAMTAAGAWWLLDAAGTDLPDDPVDGLDVSWLHDRVIAPLLGVSDPHTDPRLRFVPGVLGLDALAREAEDGVGFALHPIDPEVVTATARVGRTLPPKSTYMHPKARSGLLLLPRR